MTGISNRELCIFQKGFNYSQDGPGNRLVYHLQGCNMHCAWCANPEGIAVNGCGLSCETLSLECVFKEIQRSRPMFFEGGGVTLTGGEPTLQMESVRGLFAMLKEEGIHTAIENNGSHARLLELLPYVDYLIMDFKHPEEAAHKQMTGISNLGIKKNCDRILESGRQLAVRIPLIHGFNTSQTALCQFLAYFAGKTNKNVTFEFLSYHEYGKHKWEQCGMPYQVKDGFVNKEVVEGFEAAFRENGLQVIHS